DGLGGTGLPSPVPWTSPPNGEEDLRCQSICERLDYCGVLEGTAAETLEDCIAVCQTWSAGFLKGTAKCNLDADKTCSELTKKCWVPGGKPPPKDPCEDVECDEPDPNTCVGEVHTAYAMKGDCNAGLCFYNSEVTDCAAIDMICDLEFGCIPDPCEDVVCGPPPASSCVGSVATVYTGAAGTCDAGDCSWESAIVDCASSSQICHDGGCMDDPCDTVTCDAMPPSSCDGDQLTSYTALGTCDMGECSYAPTVTNCAGAGQVCDLGACVEPPDLCEDVVCDSPPDDHCDGDHRVVYAPGGGSCELGLCVYDSTLTDCSASDQICTDAACVEPPNLCEGVTCDDGDPCTDDFCVGITGVCDVTILVGGGCCAEDANCDDGVFCNGPETCDPGTHTCQAPVPPVCDDEVECTLDFCNVDTDACDVDTDNHEFCDDGEPCNGNEKCAKSGCIAGAPIPCPGGYSCVVGEGTCACDQDKAEVFSGCDPCPGTTLGTCADEELVCVCEAWVFPTMGEIWATPAHLPNDNIALGNFHSRLYGVSPDGDENWAGPTVLGGAVQENPVYDPASGRVMVATLAGILYAINPDTGVIEDSRDMNAPPGGDITVSNGVVYYAGYDGWLTAVNAASLVILWAHELPDILATAPAVDSGGTAYVGCLDHSVYAVNAAGILWSKETGDQVWSSPAVGPGGGIYFGSNDGHLYGMNPDGSAKWSPCFIGGEIWAPPLVGDDGQLYVMSTSNTVRKVDIDTGQKMWLAQTAELTTAGPSQGADGSIFVATTTGKLYAISPDTGEIRWIFEISDAPQPDIHAAPLLVGDRVYVGSKDRKLYALDVYRR
ncbi:MAG: PQQ-binding-like beta-propeller repeat protein, partial [Myxococcota bacterium]|nr:PQQ-binding-like beta-propeller repeat protein [Myxococcota bacterium]